jgi:hypothetical protein
MSGPDIAAFGLLALLGIGIGILASDHYPYMTPWLWSRPLMQVSTDTARWILWVNGNDLPSLMPAAWCIGSIGSGSQSSKRLSYTISRDMTISN